MTKRFLVLKTLILASAFCLEVSKVRRLMVIVIYVGMLHLVIIPRLGD
jgi:hypothetical protein